MKIRLTALILAACLLGAVVYHHQDMSLLRAVEIEAWEEAVRVFDDAVARGQNGAEP